MLYEVATFSVGTLVATATAPIATIITSAAFALQSSPMTVGEIATTARAPETAANPAVGIVGAGDLDLSNVSDAYSASDSSSAGRTVLGVVLTQVTTVLCCLGALSPPADASTENKRWLATKGFVPFQAPPVP